MSSDSTIGKDSGDEAAKSGKQTAPASGATGIFEILAGDPAPLNSWQEVVEGPGVKSEPLPTAAALPWASSAVQQPLPDAAASAPAKPVPSMVQNGGFTQLLRALNYEQIKPESAPPVPMAPMPPPEPAPAVTIPPSSVTPPSGPTTQVFRTPAPLPAAPVESPAQAAVRLFEETRKIPVQPTAPAVTPAPNTAGSAQVTSFQRTIPAQPPSSFTQIFQSLDAGAAPAKEKALPEPARMEEVPVAPIALVAAPTVMPIAGSFTQMFQALNEDTPALMMVDAVSEHAPKEVSTSAPGSFTQMFRALDAQAEIPSAIGTQGAEANRDTSNTNNAGEPAPGSFTQMFSSLAAEPILSTPPKPTSSKAAETLPDSPAAPVEGSFTQIFNTMDANRPFVPGPAAATPSPAPGSFTQMFQALDSQPAAQSGVAPVPQPTASPQTPQTAGGTFTQMFRTLNAAESEASPQRQDAGSFTQMFGPPLSEASRPQEQQAVKAGTSGASQVFATYRPPAEEPGRPEYPPSSYPSSNAPSQGQVPAARPASPTQADRGGLTQLLRTLDTPMAPMAPAAAPAAWEPPSSAQPPTSFTAVYGKLDGAAGLAAPSAVYPPAAHPTPASTPLAGGRGATQAFRVPDVATPQAPTVSAGPSEFTRILNASQFRESALRGGETAAAGAIAPASAPTSGEGFAGLSAPANPSVPQAMSSAQQAQHWGTPSAQTSMAPSFHPLPAIPQVPAVPQPRLPDAPAAGGTMQKYLPLLLILIIFLLLAILVAVVFLMKK